MTAPVAIKNDRRTIFGWAMYDWANSAYSTVIAGAILPAYFASEVVGDDGWNGRSGETLWALTLGLGTLMLFLAMPVFGAIADFSASKRRFLRVFAYGGSLFTTALFFASSGNVLYTLGFFLLAQVGFVGANVLYDGFLPDITTEDTIDKVSSRGFAIGYVGGGVYLAIVLAMIQLGADGELMARAGIAGTGVCWAGFGTFAFSRLREAGEADALPDEVRIPRSLVNGIGVLSIILVAGMAALVAALTGDGSPVVFDLLLGLFMVVLVTTVVLIAVRLNRGSDRHVIARRPVAKMAGIGFVRTFETAARLRAFPQLLLFVVAYMLYNDGVQTTINVSAVYASDTLELETTWIAVTFLIVQFVAFGGALIFGWLSSRLDIRRAIQINLVVWVGIAVIAYFLPTGQALPFMATGVVIGFVLGGIQALSRSLYGSMIPEEASAEFYGFYSVFSKFSAVWGPLIFAVVGNSTGSGRPAILSIILFFVIGFVLFSRVDIAEARRSKELWQFGQRVPHPIRAYDLLMNEEQINNEIDKEVPTPDQVAQTAGTDAGADSGIPWGLGIFLLMSVLLVVFAVQNTQVVTLNFLGWEGEFPLVVIIVAVVVVAVILDEILGVVLRRRRRRRRAEKQELKRLRAERS